jgi:DAK2 domain fusion protein YloV
LVLEGVTGEQLKRFFEGGLVSLTEHQQEIDRLNVFPVPDGDTGRNMCLTMQAAVRELRRTRTASLGGLSEALAKGSLMGARGNSGVILSQLIRGFADAVKDSDQITVAQFAGAWQAAVATAYQAVMKPVEGTILTVAKGFARGLGEAAKTELELGKALLAAVQKGNEALQLTPELLPVLKRAGVVDAGGKGLLVMFEGGLTALGNGKLGDAGLLHNEPASGMLPATLTSEFREEDGEEEDFTFTYCVDFLLRGDAIGLSQLREALQKYGGSMVLGAIDDYVKIHVHSNHPGQVLEHCLQLGTLHNIQISNMRDQWRQRHGEAATPDAVPDAGTASYQQIAAAGADRPAIGLLVVASGEGLEQIFRSLGPVQIVQGGQTMNPPVEEFVRAIEAMPYEQVLILPNNRNLIMAAEQAVKLVDRRAAVLPTRSIQAGISALVAYSPSLDLDANLELMKQAADRVKAGEVTYAVRDAALNNIEIRQGELIGLCRGDIVAVGGSLDQVVPATVDQMLDERDELITLLTGKEVLPEDANRVAALIRERHPGIDLEVQYGGQPVYYFLISVE